MAVAAAGLMAGALVMLGACASGSSSKGSDAAAKAIGVAARTHHAATPLTTTTTLNPLVAAPPVTPAPIGAGPQVLTTIPVPAGSRVVFLTLDDGLVRDPEFTRRFIRAGIPVTIFPVAPAVEEDPGFFADWLKHGAVLGDHTITHPNLHKLGYAQQQHEICGAADIESQSLGQRPRLVRPPYGNYNTITKQAAMSCGIRYIVMWHETINNGKMQFQAGDHLQPGDIILMHFRKTFDMDFDAALAQARKDGMRFGVLTDYLPQ